MQVQGIPYQQTGYFSKLICDYIEKSPSLAPFCTEFPSVSAFKKQAASKVVQYSPQQREVLLTTLRQQYRDIPTTAATQKNIDLLADSKSVTVTTGHQLCLMTGPLFFIYKIVQTIKLCEQLNSEDTTHTYVPIYWMATEDHDFEEISNFQFEGKKFQWTHPATGGPVGDLDLDSLQPLLDLFLSQLPKSQSGDRLKEIIKEAYGNSPTLTIATRKLVNALFGAYGLVIIDGAASAFKQTFAPYVRRELTHSVCETAVKEQIQQLTQNYSDAYKPQVSPREINLFFMTPGKRQRILRHPEGFQFDGSQERITQEMLWKQLDEQPEVFSPNVLMRPLYQEVILPNVGYVGGGGELAYWLELKNYFSTQEIPFPILVLRNSAVLCAPKAQKKMKKLEVAPKDFFLRQSSLINKKIRQISNIDLDLSPLRTALEANFDALDALVTQTDVSFKGAVAAQKQKQFKGIEHLEKRLLLAQKRKLKDHVQRLSFLYETLFPGESLQERQHNITSFYLGYGSKLIPDLMEVFDPLGTDFLWIDL